MSGSVAVSEWTLREPTTRVALTRIARAGFGCVELGGTVPDIVAAGQAVRATGLRVTSVCPLLGPEYDLASADAVVRTRAIELVRGWIDVAVDLGAPIVIVVPSDRPHSDDGVDALAWAADSLRILGETLGADDPRLVIEPLNRYETHLVRTVDDAARLCALVGLDEVRLMGDTFHMAIEEDDPIAALTGNSALLAHVHLADNQRRAPGTGRLDFGELRQCLEAIGFAGTAALECLPCTDDDLQISAGNLVAAGWTL